MEKISWTDILRNEEMLYSVKEDMNILHTVKRRKANWIAHVLCSNHLLKRVFEREEEG
jgi:4'-phosphopantetheinyl transferase EntD